MDATVANMLELVSLEAMLRGECRCEGRHRTIECSGEVTHLLTNCFAEHAQRKVCQNTADYTYRELAAHPLGTCAGCKRSIHDCWSIRPI